MDTPISLVRLDTVTSTNDHASELASGGAPEGTVVLAERQTAGRGRRARSWVSEPGNLFASIIVRPKAEPARVAEIGFVAANAVVSTVREFVPKTVTVGAKWPNDVLVNGSKVSGLLLEAAPIAGDVVDWLVVGVGINLCRHPDDTLYPATSITEEGGTVVSPEAAIYAFYGHFARGLASWRADGFKTVRAEWLTHAAGIGEAVTVRLDRETLSGVFKDLDTDGALVLSQGTKTRRIAAGDLFPAHCPH